jgi:Ser/Thr protein kinase RdoA (MazF antagonist)
VGRPCLTPGIAEFLDSEFPRAATASDLTDSDGWMDPMGLVGSGWLDLGGSVNLNLLVDTGCRHGLPERVVFRVYRPWTTQSRVVALRSLRQLLHQRGLRVPRPLSMRAGPLTVIDGHVCEIEEHLNLPERLCGEQELAAGLAALHEVTTGVVERNQWRSWPRFPNFADNHRLLMWARETEARLALLPDGQILLRRISHCFDLLTRLDMVRQPGRTCITHGDPSSTNLFAQDGEFTYLDFDVAAAGGPMSDLAVLLRFMLRHDLARPGGPKALTVASAATALLGAYQAGGGVGSFGVADLLIELVRVSVTAAVRAGLTSWDEGPRPQLVRALELCAVTEVALQQLGVVPGGPRYDGADEFSMPVDGTGGAR